MKSVAEEMTRLTGWRAVARYAAFITDPVKAMMEGYERHGPFLALHNPTPFRSRAKYTAQIVGARYNRPVLSDDDTWRAAGLSLRGGENSALRRLRWNMLRMPKQPHDYYRRLLQPPLRRAPSEQCDAEIAAVTLDHVSAWRRDAPVDLCPLISAAVREGTLRLLFPAAPLDDNLAVAAMVDRYLKLSGNLPANLCPIPVPGTPYARAARHAEATERSILDWAEHRRGHANPRDLMSLIVNAPDHSGQPQVRDGITGQVPLLFGASYETAEAALAWTLFLLAQHPRVAGELRDEIDAATRGGPPTMAAVGELPLLDAIIKESLRMMPVVPFQLRVSRRPSVIEDMPIPMGTRMLVCCLMTNRVPEIYPEPGRFKPERWFGQSPRPYDYMTFGAGPRMCIGYFFAVTMMKIMLAVIIPRLRIEMAPGARVDCAVSVTMYPKRGLPVIIRGPDRDFRAVPVRGDIHRLIALPG